MHSCPPASAEKKKEASKDSNDEKEIIILGPFQNRSALDPKITVYGQAETPGSVPALVSYVA